MSISSSARLGPISGNAISVSCQNSNCLRQRLRRERRCVIQRVKRLSSEFSAPPSTTSKGRKEGKDGEGCATKECLRCHQIHHHQYHYWRAAFRPENRARSCLTITFLPSPSALYTLSRTVGQVKAPPSEMQFSVSVSPWTDVRIGQESNRNIYKSTWESRTVFFLEK